MSAPASNPDSVPTRADPFDYVPGPAGILHDFRLRGAPKWAIYVAITAVVASWVPLALIYRAWHNTSPLPRIHIFQDMDNQPRFRPQDDNALFADGRAMRPQIAGTVARGKLTVGGPGEDHYFRGFSSVPGPDGKPVVTFFNGYPAPIQEQLNTPATAEAFLLRGQSRFNIYCLPCHGADGQGAGPIHVRADTLARNGIAGMSWVAPNNLVDETRRLREDGHLYNTVTNGIRNMGGYGDKLSIDDRWAIVAYVRTLQFAQTAKADAVPPEKRGELK